jgi:D-sedoheptulose 7-phosphate isomerase
MEHAMLIERLFQNSISAKIDCVESVTPALLRAGQCLVDCLLSERKILVCGDGPAAQDAPWLASALMLQSERERPALPAVLLAAQGQNPSGTGHEFSPHDVFGRQVSALGQAGDVLVIFTHGGAQPALLNAVHAAHERHMLIVALTAHDGGNVPDLLDVQDVEVRVPLSSRFRIHEMFLLLSFALCELVEWQLFGGE